MIGLFVDTKNLNHQEDERAKSELTEMSTVSSVFNFHSRMKVISQMELWILTFLFYLWVPAKSHQSCLALCEPVDCTPPGSSVHGILQARTLAWVACTFLQGIFLTQGSIPGLLHCRWILYHLSHQGR